MSDNEDPRGSVTGCLVLVLLLLAVVLAVVVLR
jgi:hypothetical protein